MNRDWSIHLQCFLILLTMISWFYFTHMMMKEYKEEILEMNRRPYEMFIQMIDQMKGEK